MDSFKESDHPRAGDGNFSESGSSGQSKAESQQKNNAREQQEVKVSATGANKFKKGFSSKNLDAHWDGDHAHKDQYPNMTKKQYAERALDLIQQPVGGKVDGYQKNDGKIVRYDKESNDIVVGHPEKGIATMFKPKNGYKYFLANRKRDTAKKEES